MQRITPDATNQTITIHFSDTAGADKTDLVFGDMTLNYRRGATGALTAITAATQTVTGAHSDGGFVHISGGNYRLDLPDAAVATGVDVVEVFASATDAIQTAGAAAIQLDLAVEAIDTLIGTPAGADVSADIAALPTAAEVNTAVEAGQIGTDTAAILIDTADMQPKLGTPAADLAADIAALPTAAEVNTAVEAGQIGTDTAAILVDTADMQPKLGTPAADLAADIAALPTSAAINTAVEAGQIGTDTAAILVDTADMQPKLGTPAADVSADIAALDASNRVIVESAGYQGDHVVSDTIITFFRTRNGQGVPTSLVGGTVEVYENGVATNSNTGGLTLDTDYDGITGLNVLTNLATAAHGYTVNSYFNQVLTAGTVDGVSVAGTVIGSYTLERHSVLDRLNDGSDGLAVIKADTAAILVDTDALPDAAAINTAVEAGQVGIDADAAKTAAELNTTTGGAGPWTTATGLGGGGGAPVFGRLDYVGFMDNRVLDVIQGEEQQITTILETDGSFVLPVTAFQVEMKDVDGTKVTIADGDITRITEDTQVLVLRFTLTTAHTASLAPGAVNMEVTLDNAKCQIQSVVNIIEEL